MKAFISSVIAGFQPFRDAASRAARTLRHEVIKAEDLGAAPDSPQRVCLAGVRKAEVLVLILGARYGEIQPSGLSATHEEFREARERCAVLVFIQEGVTREPHQEDFVREVRDWASGHYTASFSDAEDLKDSVVTALHELELSNKVAADTADDDLVQRAQGLVPREHGFASPSLALVVVGAPRQQVLRPVDIERDDFADRILKEAMFGKVAVFSTASGCDRRVQGDQLVLRQPDASVLVDQTGSVRIVQPARAPGGGDGSYLSVLIAEDVQERLERGLRFVSWLLDEIDAVGRLSRVAPLVALVDAGYTGWKTRAEHRRQPNTVQMNVRGDDALVMLSPAGQPRASLRVQADKLAEDLMVLLRRKVRQ